ncbi:MAG: NTP pyrophosphohydrolase [Stackebrandtia sp.]
MPTPLIIVDAANVVGSRPDGWWRDRAGATRRLRDRLAGLASGGIAGGPEWARSGPLEIIMVAEGRARGVESGPTVTIVDAPGLGDDTIAELAADAAPRRRCLVITSDRGLRHRVTAAGAAVAGAGTLADG